MQLQAGFIFDFIKEELLKSNSKEAVSNLLSLLSNFSLDYDLDYDQIEARSELAVLHNAIIRGKPTRSSYFIEEQLCEKLDLGSIKEDKLGSLYIVPSESFEDVKPYLFRSLHLVEPRMGAPKYNENDFESGAEMDFFYGQLKETVGVGALQLFELQRLIKSINDKVPADWRADFAMEFLYPFNEREGVVIEIDGPTHNEKIQQKLDNDRKVALSDKKWYTYRIKAGKQDTGGLARLNNIVFIKIIQENYANPLYKNKDGMTALQAVLTPFAIARLQLSMLYAIFGDIISLDSDEWNICVIEHDVPCACLAIIDLYEQMHRLYSLQEKRFDLKINLTVYTSEEFSTSELHNIQVPSWLKYDKKILTEAIGTDQYDLSLDISMLKRSSSKTSWLSNKSKYLKIRSVFTSLDTRRIISNFSINYGKIITSNTDEPTVFDSIKKNLLQQFLRDFFRKGSFRDGQVELLNKTLQNQSVIGLLPTGHGKSLVYQLSALLQPGVCLVIDPIKSLMLDQSQNLTKNGIDMQNFINSWLTQPERSNNQQELSSGKALFCFISPERLQIQEFRDTLKGMWSSRVYFSYCVIDEVHCVSEWGHDFRLSYLRLGRNATEFCLTKDKANLPLIGLTATASYDVLTDVYRELSLMDEEKEVNLSEDAIVQREDVSRDELTFKIIDVTKKVSSLSGNEWNDRKMIANAKVEIILEYLHHHRSLLAKEEGFPGLIFCPHRSGSYGVSKKFKEVPSYNEVNGVYDYLLQASIHNINLGYYVGSGQDDDIENDIIENQEKFIDNEINLLVSTKAFGMGIDKPNIRYTFHFNYPQSLEGFIQEAGRAGRDKEKAESYILFHYTDKDKDIDYEVNKFFHSLANVSEEHDKRIVDVLFRGEYFTTREDTLLKKIKEKFDEPVIRFSFKNDIWYINREFVKDRNRRNNVGSITITSEGVNKKIDSLSHKKETNSEILEYIENAILEGTKKGQLPNDLSIAAIKDWFQEKQQGTSLKNFFQKRGEESLKHILPYYIKYINEENEEEVAERGEVEKALYRLTLIGAIDDYTIDYRSHTFTMYATPREDEYFFEKLYKYIRKYYSENRAKEEVQKARVYEGESALNKCLNFLIDFVYKEIVKKREQSITDMKDACFIGLGKNGEQEFKEYADLYFNSKYFRVGYEVNGENYSLTDRTDNGKIEDIELVLMFMEVVKKDSSGSETSNLKHLRGACARLQRTQPDNATLNLLKAFCLYVLAPYDNRLIEEATDSLYKGFLRFSTYYQEWRLSDLLESIGDYVKCLKLYELTENVQENIEYVTNCLAIEAHNEWLTGFNQKFLGGLPEVIAANELKEEKRPDESDSV